MTLPNKYESLLDLYDSGSLPPDEQIELAQFLIDTGLNQCDLYFSCLDHSIQSLNLDMEVSACF